MWAHLAVLGAGEPHAVVDVAVGVRVHAVAVAVVLAEQALVHAVILIFATAGALPHAGLERAFVERVFQLGRVKRVRAVVVPHTEPVRELGALRVVELAEVEVDVGEVNRRRRRGLPGGAVAVAVAGAVAVAVAIVTGVVVVGLGPWAVGHEARAVGRGP